MKEGQRDDMGVRREVHGNLFKPAMKSCLPGVWLDSNSNRESEAMKLRDSAT